MFGLALRVSGSSPEKEGETSPGQGECADCGKGLGRAARGCRSDTSGAHSCCFYHQLTRSLDLRLGDATRGF